MGPGRPRTVGDAAILRAAVEVIGRDGPGALTLGAVAKEAGVVPGTLVQRFGSKRGLLLAIARAGARAPVRFPRDGGSALAALTAGIIASMAPMDTPVAFAHHLAFLCMDLTDPEFHGFALAAHEATGEAIAGLLGQALDEGELCPGTDVTALAATVQAVAVGAGVTWALDRRSGLAARLTAQIEAVIAPHRETS
ncbi:helix-turn-helix domain-containing protein [Actinocorallia longicatena]|uniref:TetR/AcrR family transcriptional regulator n=1 Tax=Actinocorallia longicatena TaxID=111803 RepID=A0ABP6Q9M2_9ACTN